MTDTDAPLTARIAQQRADGLMVDQMARFNFAQQLPINKLALYLASRRMI